MASSKSTRILILLAIDTVFFLVELITGYIANSLALQADAFHMLNDVLSLCVGLWAVKVANQRGSSKTFTYGWQRAETLGALVNGVFLVALCVTIFLEALERFGNPQHVKNPKVLLIVGCLGLGSNILGLFLFHDHSHGHGHGGHSHGSHAAAAEEGHGLSRQQSPETGRVASPTGRIEDVLPVTRVAGYQDSQPESHEGAGIETISPITPKKSAGSRSTRQRKHSRSHSRVYSGIEDIPITPTAFRRSIIDASRMEQVDSEEDEDDETIPVDDDQDTHEHSNRPLLNGEQPANYGALAKTSSIDHREHNHAKPEESGKGGHSHGDLNMRGIFLHVMGDALGNIGVIATALIIWLTHGEWRFYFDPAVSLMITVIILCSAIPLCKAASRILLQAVPPGINVDHIKEDIEDLPGIVSCHHLHVWQLSDTKLVSSLHVQVNFDFKGEGSARYMELAQAIRKCLHEYGIHSSTIQPEFCLDPEHDHHNQEELQDGNTPPDSVKRSKPTSRNASKAGSVCEQQCLLECDDECGGKGCCGPKAKDGDDGHGHAH